MSQKQSQNFDRSLIIAVSFVCLSTFVQLFKPTILEWIPRLTPSESSWGALLTFFILIVAAMIVCLLLLEVARLSRPAPPKVRIQRIPFIHPMQPAPSAARPAQRQRTQPIHPKQSELLSLLNGDRATAQRLLSHEQQKNPGMGETWYFEKVIEDIIRDRR